MGSAAWCFSSLPIPAVHAVGGAEPFPCRWTARPTARRTPTATPRRSSPQNCTGEKCSSYFAEAYVTGQRIPRRERQLPFPVAQTPVKLCQKSANAQQAENQSIFPTFWLGAEHTKRPGQALAGNAGVADGLPISADSRRQPGQFRPRLRDLTMWIMHHQTFPFLRSVNDPRSSPAAAENSQMVMTARPAPNPL